MQSCKYLNVRERVEVVEWNCELSMSVKEDPDRKKNLKLNTLLIQKTLFE